MLVVLLRHLGYFLKFQINEHFISHFLVEVLLKLVLHDHIHIIRGQRALSKLHSQFIVEDVLWKRCGITLLALLLLLL